MPLSPRQTRALLESLGHQPRKALGQNFLIDGNTVRKSLTLAGIESGDTVVEVGPGLGTLTRALLAAGSTVYAVELDPTLAAYLRASLASEFPATFHLLEGDAVEHPRASLPAGCCSFKVVANLPYAITSPWMDALIRSPLPCDMVLMMQREAAERLTAQPGSKAYGAVSILLGAAFGKIAVHPVSRNCFSPVPGVDSVLLHLQPVREPYLFDETTRKLIRTLFTQRRKQIRPLLQHYPALLPWLDELPQWGADATSRPEVIPLPAWIALSRRIELTPAPAASRSEQS